MLLRRTATWLTLLGVLTTGALAFAADEEAPAVSDAKPNVVDPTVEPAAAETVKNEPASIPKEPGSVSGPASHIEEITVTGRAQEFYNQTAPSLENKFPGDLRQIPQSIQILPSQLIQDQAAVEITDLYRNISSVSVFSYSGVTFRGFRQDEVRYDGLLGDPFTGFSVPLLFDVEQIEVIKGPSGALFGGGEPGGLINYVTKSPTEELSGFASAVVGNYSLYGFRGEVAGPLDEDEQFFARVGAAYENTDTFRFNTNKEDIVVTADLEWRPLLDTSVLVRYDYVKQDFQGARLRGVPVDDDGNFLTTWRFNTNEKTDFQRLEANVVTVSINQSILPKLRATIAGRYIDGQTSQQYHEGRGLYTDESSQELMRREFRDQVRDTNQGTVLAELVYQLDVYDTYHAILFGGEWFHFDADATVRGSPDSRFQGQIPSNFLVPDLSLHNPVYGQSGRSFFDTYLLTTLDTRFEQWAIYLQDQIQLLDRFTLALGGRFEGYSEDVDTTQTVVPDETTTGSTVSESDEAFTVRTGIVYDVTDWAATYFNYSTGFTPQGAAIQDPDAGGPFDPERGRLFEIGAKADVWDDAIYLQLALYQINKTNVLVADPDPDAPLGALSTIGEARSRGLEIDVVGDLMDDWTFTFSYGFNDTKILEGPDEITNAVGDQFANAPAHQVGFWTRYDLDIGPIASAIAAGVSHVSDQISLNGQKVQPYTIIDASWISYWRDFQLQVNARNLLDDVYAESGFVARTGHFPGDPLLVRAALTWSY